MYIKEEEQIELSIMLCEGYTKFPKQSMLLVNALRPAYPITPGFHDFLK